MKLDLRTIGIWGLCWTALCISAVEVLRAQQQPAEKVTSPAAPKAIRQDGLIPVNQQQTVLIDKPGKRVLLKARVALTQGPLEMFCCLKQTKEHESILSLDAKAREVHSALLVIGALPGKPAFFEPEFQPPTGQKLDIFVQWLDRNGKVVRERAQRWVRRSTQRNFVIPLEALPASLDLNADTGLRYDPKRKEMYWFGIMTEAQRDHWLRQSPDPKYQAAVRTLFQESQIQEMHVDWVFCGSQMIVDENSGRERYLAEGGDLICVANFASATIDISAPSSATNQQLLYEAFTERLPPRDTEVTVELIPRPAEPARPREPNVAKPSQKSQDK